MKRKSIIFTRMVLIKLLEAARESTSLFFTSYHFSLGKCAAVVRAGCRLCGRIPTFIGKCVSTTMGMSNVMFLSVLVVCIQLRRD